MPVHPFVKQILFLPVDAHTKLVANAIGFDVITVLCTPQCLWHEEVVVEQVFDAQVQ